MATIRTCAVFTLGLLVVYYALRALASQCSGGQCDTYYLPLSLLVPLLILVMTALTGILAISAANRGGQQAHDEASKRRQLTWLSVLTGCTILGVLGVIASAVVFRDSPDSFVTVATALSLFVPVSALIYSFSD